MTDLQSMILTARLRLLDFRNKNGVDETSVHVNSLEIAINLVEFSLKTSPQRPISEQEEQWFKAGRYIELVLGNSEWQDLSDIYYNVVAEVKRNNYFR